MIPFEKPSIKTLQDLIEHELKTISLEQLKIRPAENIAVDPIYTEANIPIHVIPYSPFKINFQEFELTESPKNDNVAILKSLEEGVSGIILKVPTTLSHIDWEIVLDQVRLDYIHSIFDCSDENILDSLQKYISSQKHEIPDIQVNIKSSLPSKNECHELVHLNFEKNAADFLSQLSQNISIRTLLIELSGDYFYDICKIRAFKILLSNLTQGLTLTNEYRLIAYTPIANKSTDNKENNLVKLTTEAMSGFIGGCDGIWIRPFDNNNTAIGRRMSQNIFNLLVEESYLDLVKDPSAGSYFIENYTEQIARKIYELMSI